MVRFLIHLCLFLHSSLFYFYFLLSGYSFIAFYYCCFLLGSSWIGQGKYVNEICGIYVHAFLLGVWIWVRWSFCGVVLDKLGMVTVFVNFFIYFLWIASCACFWWMWIGTKQGQTNLWIWIVCLLNILFWIPSGGSMVRGNQQDLILNEIYELSIKKNDFNFSLI